MFPAGSLNHRNPTPSDPQPLRVGLRWRARIRAGVL